MKTLALIWILAALTMAVIFSIWQSLNLPIFTLLFLILPLISLVRHKEASKIGLKPISVGSFLKWTAVNLGGLGLMYVIFESWSGAYAFLLKEATAPGAADPTFIWLSRLDGAAGWIGLLLFSGLITIFAEELCFRGWVQFRLMEKIKPIWANLIQAALFTLPQLIAAAMMPDPVQGIVYGLVYAFGAIGLFNGWIAQQAGAIWPNLAAATLMNLILSLIIL